MNYVSFSLLYIAPITNLFNDLVGWDYIITWNGKCGECGEDSKVWQGRVYTSLHWAPRSHTLLSMPQIAQWKPWW